MNAPRPLRPAEHLPYYLSFCGKRREMLVALNAWLASNPDPAGVDIEVTATANLVRSLVDLSGSRDPLSHRSVLDSK